MSTTKQPWDNYRVYNLIATYEELFIADHGKRIMYWFGDLAIHVLKHGVSKEQIAKAYQTALEAMGKTHEDFQGDSRYIYRGNIIGDMCRHNDLPIPDYIQRQMQREELDLTLGGM